MSKEREILSPEIRRFISTHFDSVASLEILLFLRKQREREWTADQIAAELRNSPAATEARLRLFVKKGLLKNGTAKNVYQYSPNSPELELTIEEFTRLYPTYQARIIDHIYSAPQEAMEAFANAFKLKKEDEDG